VRRLAKHALAGAGFSALVISAAVGGLSSPSQGTAALAAPAPVVSLAPTPAPTEAVAVAPVDAAAATGRARIEQVSRDAARAQLAATQSKKRLNTLTKQGKLIAAQAKIEQDAADAAVKAAAKAKAAKAAAAKAAQQRALAHRGYQPGVTDPREMARQILKNKYNYGADQYSCFNFIIMRESKWDVHATNRSSGAYGIPQALPGSKMATIASDWRTNPATQIIWGIEYLKKRYGSPCGAQGLKASHGWYCVKLLRVVIAPLRSATARLALYPADFVVGPER
jgi:hypothetical protein